MDNNGKEMKDEGVIKTSGAKENHQGYNVNYKDPLTQVRLRITEKLNSFLAPFVRL